MKRNTLYLLVLLLFCAVVCLPSAAAASTGKGDRGKVARSASDDANSDSPGSAAVPTAENDPRAYTKEGLFVGVEDNKAVLIDEDTYRHWSYLLHDDYKVFYENAEYPLDWIIKGYIVKYVLIDGEVREIILLHRSS